MHATRVGQPTLMTPASSVAFLSSDEVDDLQLYPFVESRESFVKNSFTYMQSCKLIIRSLFSARTAQGQRGCAGEKRNSVDYMGTKKKNPWDTKTLRTLCILRLAIRYAQCNNHPYLGQHPHY
jgi:hypothetical protein